MHNVSKLLLKKLSLPLTKYHRIFVGQSAIYPLLRVPIPWRIVWLYGHTRSYLKSAKNIRQLLKSMRNGRLAKLGPEESKSASNLSSSIRC